MEGEASLRLLRKHAFTSLGPKFNLRLSSDWSLTLQLLSQLDK